jgi:translation initiation factor IF-1
MSKCFSFKGVFNGVNVTHQITDIDRWLKSNLSPKDIIFVSFKDEDQKEQHIKLRRSDVVWTEAQEVG